jgi:hypothetical protein
MTTRNAVSAREAHELARWLEKLPPPFTVRVSEGGRRTLSQNALIHKWFGEIAVQTGESETDVKRHCKGYYGVPILCAHDPEFADFWREVKRAVPDPEKRLKALDFVSVTSAMTTKQLSQFAETMMKEYAERGIVLTDPERA